MGIVNVPNSWQKALAGLCDFVAGDPKIEIGLNIVAIPGDVRARFYQLFDAVRVSFLEENFPDLIDGAGHLSRSYVKAEKEVTKLLELDEVSLPTSLNRFLHEPTNSLMRGLSDPLFNLLKGKIDTEVFGQEATSIIEGSFRNSYRSGYKKWVALSLVKLLVPDRAFNITPPEFDSGAEADVQIDREDLTPEPVETKRLSFEQGLSSGFLAPDFIVHSVKIDGYAALGTELGHANWTATKVSDKREWYAINDIVKKYGRIALQPDLTIYIDDEPEDIALIANLDRFCRPDLIIECLAQKEGPEKVSLERIKLRHDTLKPRLGTYIVSRASVPEEVYKELVPQQVSKESVPEQASQEPMPEQTAKKQEADIHILTVGFDQSRLETIIELLTSQKGSTTDGNQ